MKGRGGRPNEESTVAGEGARPRAAGEGRARQARGGAGRGAGGPEGSASPGGRAPTRPGREEGQAGRPAALTQPPCVERAGVWPTGQASGSIMGWRGLRRQGEYYGLEQP